MVQKKKNSKAAKPAQGKVKRGDKYVCGICGLSVMVDESSCSEQACNLSCCGEPMTNC